MLKFRTTNRFERDYKLVLKRGKDEKKIVSTMKKLIMQEPLDPKHKDHSLIASFKVRRECHIESDWLLIYKLSDEEIIFERTGTHSDLFG
jgi:mRNA interferase YafQ